MDIKPIPIFKISREKAGVDAKIQEIVNNSGKIGQNLCDASSSAEDQAERTIINPILDELNNLRTEK